MVHPLRRQIATLETARSGNGAGLPSAPSARAGMAVALLASTALGGLSASPALAQDAVPQGGQIMAGSAVIASGSQGVTIDQSSARAVIAWDSFSLGQGQTARFNGPGPDAATLNRVTGSAASTIAGTITGNGQVFLVNPNGIAITATGTVATGGGFVASTLDLADHDFMSGMLRFSGTSSALVRNAGRIEAGPAGFAALLGSRVVNSGTISVPLGRIGIGAGQAATLDLEGDGFLQVTLPSTATGPDSLLEAGGTLSGARIALRAADAAELVRNTVHIPGHLRATGAHAEGGTIVIEGGDGRMVVSGTLDASSATAQGGTIELGGRDLVLTGASLIADGATGGGTIRVGGGLTGAPRTGLTAARSLDIDAASSVTARAEQQGNGGTISVVENVRACGSNRLRQRAPCATQMRFFRSMWMRLARCSPWLENSGTGSGTLINVSATGSMMVR